MEDTSIHVKLQLRVGDKIYESVVSSNAVAEVLMKGDLSEVAETVSQSNVPVSSAMGKYMKRVEVLSVLPLDPAQVQDTEVQVSCVTVEIDFSLFHCKSQCNVKISYCKQVVEAVAKGSQINIV